jgi:hypothetical protein
MRLFKDFIPSKIYDSMSASIQFHTLGVLDKSVRHLRFSLEAYIDDVMRDSKIDVNNIYKKYDIPNWKSLSYGIKNRYLAEENITFLKNRHFVNNKPINSFHTYSNQSEGLKASSLIAMTNMGAHDLENFTEIVFSSDNVQEAINYLRRELCFYYEKFKPLNSTFTAKDYFAGSNKKDFKPRIDLYDIYGVDQISLLENETLTVYEGENSNKKVVCCKYDNLSDLHGKRLIYIADQYNSICQSSFAVINSNWRPELNYWLVKYEFYDEIYRFNKSTFMKLFPKDDDNKNLIALCGDILHFIIELHKRDIDDKTLPFLRFLNVNMFVLALSNDYKKDKKIMPFIIEFIYPKVSENPKVSELGSGGPPGTSINVNAYEEIIGVRKSLLMNNRYDPNEKEYYNSPDFINLFNPSDGNMDYSDLNRLEQSIIYQLGVIFRYVANIKYEDYDKTDAIISVDNHYYNKFPEAWWNLLEIMTSKEPENSLDLEMIESEITDILKNFNRPVYNPPV